MSFLYKYAICIVKNEFMNKTTPLTIKPSAQGERASIGGCKPHYDEFARCVYDCILDDSLEEIRVADDEELSYCLSSWYPK